MKRAFRLGRFKSDVERDVHDEIDFHIEMRTRELVEKGMGEEEARAKAEEAFGELQRIERDVASRDHSRRRRQSTWDTIEALVMVWETRPPDEHARSDRTMTVNPANYLDWASEAGSFSAMAAFNIDFATLTGEGDPERVVASVVIPGFFGVLGVQPAFGMSFSQEHGQPGLDKVAILSDGLWQRRYGGDLPTRRVELTPWWRCGRNRPSPPRSGGRAVSTRT